MKDYLCLTKTLLVTFFRHNKESGKERMVTYIVLIIVGAICAAGIAVLFALVGPTFAALGMVAEAVTMLLDVGFVTVLIFGTIGIFSYVYFAKDSEFLFSLPVRNSTVYVSKLTVVYFQELFISTLIMLPGLIALGIVTGQGVLFYLMILLAITLVPICPLFISSLIAIPMMTVASYFKNKGAVSAILLIVLFAVIVSVYMYFSMSMQTSAAGNVSLDEMMEIMKASMSNISRVLYPLLCLARFGTMTAGFVPSIAASVVIDLAVFLGTVAVGAVITIIVSGAVYGKSVLKQNEHGKNETANRDYVQSAVLKALIKKEWRELVRNTSFAFQCLSGVIIAPIFGAMFIFITSGEVMGLGEDFVIVWFTALLMVQAMSGSMNISAATALTREGKSFAYSKSMPVPYSTQLLAKVIVSDAIAVLSVVLSIITMTVTCAIRIGYVDVLAVILSPVFLVLFSMAYTNLCVLRDAKKPKLDWVTPREAVKSNVALMAPIMIGMLVSILCGIALIAVAIAFTYFFDLQTVGILIGLSVMIIASALVLVFSSYRIKNNADRLYAQLTV